ncbi:MAG: hypothetical protein U0325_32090 [Polyangiales bacterium]
MRALVWGLVLASSGAFAQTREPLCAMTRARRLASAPVLLAEGRTSWPRSRFGVPRRTGGFAGLRVTLTRPPRVGERRGLPRALAELEYQGPAAPSSRGPGLVIFRVDADFAVRGTPVRLPDPVGSTRGDETFPPGSPRR